MGECGPRRGRPQRYVISVPMNLIDCLERACLGGHCVSEKTQNLDAVVAFKDEATEETEGRQAELASEAYISVVCHQARARGAHERGPGERRPRATKFLSVRQANYLVAAVAFANEIGLPLVAHATIHWSGTNAWDDPDGTLFAKVREGLDKYLHRRGICGGLTGIWCRECRPLTDVVHCHLLFHLPEEFRSGAKLLQVEAALNRLVARHGEGLWGEFAVNLTIHPHADGLYLLTGGNDVWREFKIRKEWRESQGIIRGKRCGTTENIERAARRGSTRPKSSAS
jgi:hypothetical protein